MANDIITPSGTEIINVQQVAGESKAVTTQGIADLAAAGSTPFKGTFADLAAADAGVASPSLGDYVLIESAGAYTHVDGTLLTVYTDPSSNGVATDTNRNNMSVYDDEPTALIDYPGGTWFYGITSDAGATVQTRITTNGTSGFDFEGAFDIKIAYDAAHVGLLGVPQSNVTDPIRANATYNGTGFLFAEAQIKDGDYGDVSVSNSGKTITVDTDSITVTQIAADAVGASEVIDNSLPSTKLTDSGVTAGSYALPNVTVNDKGIITSIANGSANGSSLAVNTSIVNAAGTGTFSNILTSLVTEEFGLYRLEGQVSYLVSTVGAQAEFCLLHTSGAVAGTFIYGSWWTNEPSVSEKRTIKIDQPSALPNGFNSGSIWAFATPAETVASTERIVYFDMIVQTQATGTFSLGIAGFGTALAVQVPGNTTPSTMLTTRLSG
jgi:hypothetical protein